jgi:hypothetical protein
MSPTLEKAAKSNVQKKQDIDPNLQEKLVREEVLDKLGTVKDFYKITAKNVYYNKWRVNVWTCEWPENMYGPNYNIKYSYFCTVQDNCIAESNPEIIPVKLQLGV